MKKSSKIISVAMAALMAGSTAAAAVSASAATVKKPTKVKAVNTKTGVKISWKKAKGAKKYKVYRENERITTTKKTSFVDKMALNGLKYKYTVKAVNGKTVKAAKAVSAYRLSAPSGVKVTATKTGVKVSWSSTVVRSHKVYRKSGTGKYKLIKTTKNSANSYTDKNLKNGTKYTYKVKAIAGKDASVFSAAKSIRFLTPVTLTSLDKTIEGKKATFTLKWKANSAAKSYDVYRLYYNNEKQLLGSVTGTTYTDTFETVNPTVIGYTVYAVNGNKSTKAQIAVLYAPKDTYFTDSEGNVNVNITLFEGEKYIEGNGLYIMYLVDFPNDESMLPKTEVVEGKDVVKAEYGMITALSEGTAKIKVTFSPAVAEGLNNYLEYVNSSFKNKLNTGAVYVNVKVVKPSVVGKWFSKEAAGTYFEFREDGTGVLGMTDGDLQFTYNVKGDSVEQTFEGGKEVQNYKYTIKDGILSLTDENGATIDYRK